jgi:hypothetical protein
MNMHDPFSEASEAPALGVVMPPSEQSDTAENQVRKMVRRQLLYKRSYKADELRATLKQRASKSGRSLGLVVKGTSVHACCKHAAVHAGDSMLRREELESVGRDVCAK